MSVHEKKEIIFPQFNIKLQLQAVYSTISLRLTAYDCKLNSLFLPHESLFSSSSAGLFSLQLFLYICIAYKAMAFTVIFQIHINVFCSYSPTNAHYQLIDFIPLQQNPSFCFHNTDISISYLHIYKFVQYAQERKYDACIPESGVNLLLA